MNATLIYDGDCPMCRRAVHWVRARVPEGRVEYLPCQAEERAARFPQIATEQCMEAMQLVTAAGEVHSGDRALPPLLRMMRRWRWLAVLFHVPGVSLAAPVVYRFIARHRYAISGFFRHEEGAEGARCSVERGCE